MGRGKTKSRARARDRAALALFLVSQLYGLVVLSKSGAVPATLERVVNTALSALEA